MIEAVRKSGLGRIAIGFAAAGLAFLPVIPSPASSMTIELCTADGEVRSISIPIEQHDDGRNDCAKPCHACLSRSKAKGKPAHSN